MKEDGNEEPEETSEEDVGGDPWFPDTADPNVVKEEEDESLFEGMMLDDEEVDVVADMTPPPPPKPAPPPPPEEIVEDVAGIVEDEFVFAAEL